MRGRFAPLHALLRHVRRLAARPDGRVPSLLLCLLLIAACPPPPATAPTVATLVPSRAGVTVTREGRSVAAPPRRRVEGGAAVRTPAGVRATLYLDRGAWVLLDGGSEVEVRPEGLALRAGRAWIDARGADPLKVLAASGAVALGLTSAGLSVSAAPGGAHVYCAAGQVTWQAGKQGGRLESGLSLLYKDGKSQETAQALWEDWTLGLAEPGPLRPLEPAGVGQLLGRRPDEAGQARAPLILRHHEVRVRIRGDLAETTVEQTFFNARSETVEGLYAVRLPERAILGEFAVGQEDGAPQPGRVVPRARPQEGSVASAAAQLEWAGPGRYRGLLRGLRPGKSVQVLLRYSEWLPRQRHPDGTRRSYVYPMGQAAGGAAGEAPSLGEFTLEVDLSDAGAQGVAAGMGAQVEGRRVVLRRSDFRPRADFALDLLDGPPARDGALAAYRGASADGARYLLVQPPLDTGPAPQRLDLVLVVDVSAGTDPAHLDLARGAAQALLQQLGEGDRVAVLAASSSVRALGREPLGPASRARVEELLDQLGGLQPGGATDLGGAIGRAVALLPPGQGTIIYIGDGRPSVGALLPGELRDQLQRLGPLPRLYAIAVGPGADRDLLQALCASSGGAAGPGAVVTALDRPEATRAALHLLERAARPALTGVTVALGEAADVVYPEAPVTLEAGEALEVVARLVAGRPLPRRMVVQGLRAGAPFREEIALGVRDLDDGQDLARRWAQARLLRLLERGAGREAAADIGTRFQVVTPWTALVAGAGGRAYALVAGEEERGTFLPPALRDRAPEDGPLMLEDGVSTAPSRSLGVEELYQRALGERQATARVCYDRKAAGHPELSGRVTLRVRIGLDGAVQLAKVQTTTLRARDVEECIERAVSALRLPPPPDGKIHEVAFALQLEQEGDSGPRSCSAAARAYLQVRRALWRERLAQSPGAGGAMAVWREARARCELRSWVDRRALLDLLLAHSGRTTDQVDLYHRFDGEPERAEVQEYLRRQILRGVRTQEDVQAAQAGLQLDGGIDAQLVERELVKARTTEAQIAVLRRFLELQPGALALRVRLLGLLEEAGRRPEALRLAEALRADPGADARVRQAVGELYLRAGDGAEGARALSEIVELAPYDPWARRRLGDLYLGHRLHEAAYREYQVLGWLLPQDESVLLKLSSAAFGAGRSDEALRLLLRVGEAVGSQAGPAGPPAWARALYAARFAQLLDAAQRKGDRNLLGQLLVRGRSDGVAGFAGELLVAVVYEHPDAGLSLLTGPAAGGAEALGPAAVRGGAVGIEAQRYERAPGALLIAVRRAQDGPARDGELVVLSGERALRQPVRLGDGRLELRFQLQGGRLQPR